MTLHGIGSMATRLVLAELAATYSNETGLEVKAEAIGGLDVERRVLAREPFDFVVLAAATIERLASEGNVTLEGSVDVARSGMAIAVPTGEPHPDIRDGEAVRAAVIAARGVGYSTGPSGKYVLELVERWQLGGRIGLVNAPPGVPVASLLARGEATLGFQQMSELLEMPGIEIVGPMPPDIQLTTVFRGAVCSASRQPTQARSLLAWLASTQTAAVKRRYGMEP
jgi:ABC-type molybdate transport system, periplasmic component